MANPQAENGHTDISNEIMEALARYRIPGAEWQVLLVVLRKTYGWHKLEDAISLSQFAELTGLDRSNVVRALKGLVSKEILRGVKSDTTGKVTNKYRFNKDYHKWVSGVKSDTGVVSKTIIKVVSKATHTKESFTKEKVKRVVKEEIPFVLPDWIDPEAWAGYEEMRKEKKKVPTARARALVVKELDRLRAAGNDPNACLNQSTRSQWTDVYALKEKSVSPKAAVVSSYRKG